MFGERVNIPSISTQICIILFLEKSLLDAHVELVLSLFQSDFVDCVLDEIDLHILCSLEGMFVLKVGWRFPPLKDVFLQIVGFDE